MNTALLPISKTLLATLILGLLLSGVALAQEETEVEAEGSVAIESDVTTDRAAARAEIEGQRTAVLEEREAIRASTSAQREVTREEMTDSKEERRSALSERGLVRITNLSANISNKMDAAADRIQNIITRIDTRIDKLEAAGLDVSEAEAALQSAQISLNAAVNNLATIDVTVQVAVTSEDPRSSWTSVKTAYQNIHAQLRTAHTEIKASVQALKDSAQEMERERDASTTTRSGNRATETDITSEASTETSIE